ncbi:MAG: VCBS repeat-containing protein [Candidatus Aminicenantes bacterium]|nr:VCBS repeat-containing protein [Candidatus Aminicenantes bacterium]
MIIISLSLLSLINGSSDFSTIFNRFELKFDQYVEDIAFEDINEDQLKDIFLFTKVNDKKELHLFFQSKHGFSLTPSQTLAFEDKAIIFDVANLLDQYPGKEIVFLTSSALKSYCFQNGSYSREPIKLMDISSLFQFPSPESPVRSKFIWNIGGETYLFIPAPGSLKILGKNKNETFGEIQQIHLEPIFSVRSHLRISEDLETYESFSQKVIIQVPRLYLEDFNGDGRKDLLSLFEDKIKVFYQHENKIFSEEPNFELELGVLTDEEKKSSSPPFYKVLAMDLNNDNLIDLLASKSQIRTMKSLSKLYIYLNKKGKIEPTPDQILVNESFFGFPEVLDVNGDHYQDLVISEIKMGLFQIFKMLLTKKITYEDVIFLGKNGRFPLIPASRIRSEVIVDFDNPEKSEGDVAFFNGDFNRDGIKDVLRKIEGKNEITISLGRLEGKDLKFSDKATYLIKEELSSRVILEDLNQDNVTDLVLDFRKDKKKKIVIFLSK